ncbi:MAG: toll/interleukin-1 receptor domain-containing protein [Pseudomonadota bacterium]
MTDSENGAAARRPTAFISHHSSQAETARRLKAILGHHGITGWMAPDDIDPGQTFDTAIVDQVRRSDLIILLFCAQSDQSRHVKRELMMAEDADKLIFPVRLEDTAADGLAYWLNDYQWIDWFDGEDDTITRMIETINRQAASSGSAGGADRVRRNPAAVALPGTDDSAEPVSGASASSRSGGGSQWTVPVVTALVVAVVMLAGFYFMIREDEPDGAAQVAQTEGAAPDEAVAPEEEAADAEPETPLQTPAVDTGPTPVPATGTDYYVVVGSFQPGDPTADLRAREFETCSGIAPIVGRSDDYAGLTPGLTVVMTGGYADAQTANAALEQAQACVADAYIRFIG